MRDLTEKIWRQLVTTIERIISGGQTGADQAGLFAARELGLKTGGWAPKGFWTDAGHQPTRLSEFGLVADVHFGYSHRTFLNVRAGDGTLIFGNVFSPGCKLTQRFCHELNRPMFLISWSNRTDDPTTDMFLTWLTTHRIKVLNVAGNRERTNPGIFLATFAFLLKALGDKR